MGTKFPRQSRYLRITMTRFITLQAVRICMASRSSSLGRRPFVTGTLRVSTASERRPRKMAEEQNLSKGASYELYATAMERLDIHFSRYGMVLTLRAAREQHFNAGAS